MTLCLEKNLFMSDKFLCNIDVEYVYFPFTFMQSLCTMYMDYPTWFLELPRIRHLWMSCKSWGFFIHKEWITRIESPGSKLAIPEVWHHCCVKESRSLVPAVWGPAAACARSIHPRCSHYQTSVKGLSWSLSVNCSITVSSSSPWLMKAWNLQYKYHWNESLPLEITYYTILIDVCKWVIMLKVSCFIICEDCIH